jgi:Kef-type K+ transport system membrane component KefB
LAAPLALGLFPRVRLPAIVLEVVLGIVIRPQVLGWVSIDTPIQVMSLLGLAFLLLLAGLEVYERFRVKGVKTLIRLNLGFDTLQARRERRHES